MTGNFTWDEHCNPACNGTPRRHPDVQYVGSHKRSSTCTMFSEREMLLQRHLTLAKRKMAPMGVDLTPLWVYSHVAGVVKPEAVSLLRQKNANNSAPEIVTITTM